MDKKRKLSKDNRGLTLLEVIVAAAIFSIAAIVLMQGFVTSGRINKKSNLYLEATSTAQNVMEELKAKDFEEIALAFNYPLTNEPGSEGQSRFHFLTAQKALLNAEGGITVRERIYDGNNKLTNVRTGENGGKEGDPLSSTVLSGDGGRTYTLNPRQQGTYASQYFFEILNYTNKKETFDIKVTLDGGKNSKYKKQNIQDEDEKNDYESPNIAKLDNKSNALLLVNKVWENTALDNMLLKQSEAATAAYTKDKTEWQNNPDNLGKEFPRPEPEPLDKEDVSKQLKRTTMVTLSQENGIVKAMVTYKLYAYDYAAATTQNYYANFKNCPCKGKGNDEKIEGCYCTARSVETTFYASETDAELKNLYIFYYPNYSSADRLNPLDNIGFINESNYPVNLYVVKEKSKGDTDMAALSKNEKNYKMNLTIQENPTNEKTDSGNAKEDSSGEKEKVDNSNWYTNLNLYKAQTKLRTNLNLDISKEAVKERESTKQMSLSYKDMNGKEVSDITAEKILSYNGLENRKQKDSIYKMSVKVYKAGAQERGYPDDELIASLDGSKED